jgi:hypothetical protein
MFPNDIYTPRFTTREMLASSGDGAGGGGPAGPGSSNGSATNTGPAQGASSPNGGQGTGGGPDWGAYISSLDGLGEKITSALGPKLDQLNGTVNGMAQPQPEPEPQIDYDALTPGQLHDLVISKVDNIVSTAIENALKPYQDEQVRLRTDFVTKSATDEVNTLRSANKDYMDWGPEMIELSKANPSMSLPDLYIFAKAKNPDKAKELEAKYNPPPAPPRRPFAVGNSSVTSDGQAPPKPMSSREAVMSAARSVDQKHGGALSALMQTFPSS